MNCNRIIFVTSTMHGGVGRVLNILNDQLFQRNYDVRIVNVGHINDSNHIVSYLFYMCCAFVQSRLFHNSYKSSIYKFKARKFNKFIYLKNELLDDNNTVISFLNEPIFLSLLAKRKNQKLIISERNDPFRFIKTKTTMAFIKTMYQKADIMVCQSPDAKKWYDENSSVKTTVIFNPIKSDLPQPYNGLRNKRIVNFCRISSQKNLTLLVEAFSKLLYNHSDYELEIYGNADGNGADGYLDEVNAKIEQLGISGKVHIFPAEKDIHSKILDYAMFVSSSDFEGMSNSMLEAMAIGLPVVCTDCPAGGARAVIQDHVNGLLTPVGDVDALCKAMTEIIENPELAARLSENAVKIRETQSVDRIVEQWLEIIND